MNSDDLGPLKSGFLQGSCFVVLQISRLRSGLGPGVEQEPWELGQEVRTFQRHLLVTARAEKSHAGWRLFHCHSEEIGRDVRDKHVFQEAPGRTPVRLCVRLVRVVAKAPPAVAQVQSSYGFWFAAAGFVRIAGTELVHAPARIPVLQSRASCQRVLHHPLLRHGPCRKCAALSGWCSSIFDSVGCTFDHTSDASQAGPGRGGAGTAAHGVPLMAAARWHAADSLQVEGAQTERLVDSIPVSRWGGWFGEGGVLLFVLDQTRRTTHPLLFPEAKRRTLDYLTPTKAPGQTQRRCSTAVFQRNRLEAAAVQHRALQLGQRHLVLWRWTSSVEGGGATGWVHGAVRPRAAHGPGFGGSMAEGTAGGTFISGGAGETSVSEAGGLERFLHARTKLHPLRSDQVMVARRLRRRFTLGLEVSVQWFPPTLLPAWGIWPGQQDLRPLLGARLDSWTWLRLFHLLFIIWGGAWQARRGGGGRRAICSYLRKWNLSWTSSWPLSFLLEQKLSFLFSTGKQIIGSQQLNSQKWQLVIQQRKHAHLLWNAASSRGSRMFSSGSQLLCLKMSRNVTQTFSWMYELFTKDQSACYLWWKT